MSLLKRIIFCLYYKDGFFYISRNFRLQKVGNVEWLIKNLPERNKEQTVELMETVNKKNQSRNNHEWFARDGQHPDRNGHELLYKQIKDKIFTIDE